MKREDLERLIVRLFTQGGDAIEGEKIIGQARSVRLMGTVPGTSSHRIQEVVLKTNALCVLDRPFRVTHEGEQPFTLRE